VYWVWGKLTSIKTKNSVHLHNKKHLNIPHFKMVFDFFSPFFSAANFYRRQKNRNLTPLFPSFSSFNILNKKTRNHKAKNIAHYSVLKDFLVFLQALFIQTLKQNLLFYKKKIGSKKSKLEDFIFGLIHSYPNNLSLYQEAFTHPSVQAKNELGVAVNYERLEFLGDAVLGMVVAAYFYANSPNKNEGELTQIRSKIVNRNYLNKIGHSLGLEAHLINLPNHSPSINVSGNMLEALIAAIYIDKGYELAKKFILDKVIVSDNLVWKLEKEIVSYRSYLLEWSQKHKIELEFRVYQEENANNFIIFVCEIFRDNQMLSRGREISKKKAVEKASKRAFYSINKK
jgi:ribonuclease III